MNYHKDILEAIYKKDSSKICDYLHTNHYESDAQSTINRCNDSFIQGWEEAIKFIESRKCENCKYSFSHNISKRMYLGGGDDDCSFETEKTVMSCKKINPNVTKDFCCKYWESKNL